MDYKKFNYNAVVDWIEFEIHTVRTTNFQAIRRALKDMQQLSSDAIPFVETQDVGLGGAASIFRFRIQDPVRFDQVNDQLLELGRKFDLVAPVKIVGIEVAFDAYRKSGTTCDESEELDELALMSARFNWGLSKLVSPNCRMYHKWIGSAQVVPPPRQLALEFMLGYTLGIGHKNDDIYQRIYFKREDNKQQLTESEQRARIEIRLQGKNVPVTSLDGLESFNFVSLSKYFNFRCLRPDLDSTTQRAMESVPRIGQPYRINRNGNAASINRKDGGTREQSKVTRADIPLNEHTRDQLKKLTKRWQNASSSSGKVVACGNKGGTDETFISKRSADIHTIQSKQLQAGVGVKVGSLDAKDRGNCLAPDGRSKDYASPSPFLRSPVPYNDNKPMTSEDLMTLRSMGFDEEIDHKVV